ncbi:MAG: ABC transporter ATP-binding protein [Bacteroidales bacterium]|nr:ABC transporter ATP-binding protein [Bacteroidales bacterium]
MRESTNIIDIRELEIGFTKGKKKYLSLMDGIAMSADKGEFIALIGQNGIGKSTLLKTLVKLQPILSGDVYFKGDRIQEISLRNFSRFVAYVSTEVIRAGNLKVQDLVGLGRYPYTNWLGNLTTRDHEKVDSALEMVGLTKLKNKNITEVSDGERQRAMIARTIAQDTEVLILDEPTAFLDLPNRYDVLHLLKSLAHNKGKTVIFSTHDLGLVLNEVDKIWVMTEKGVLEGSPEDLAINSDFDQLFPGSPLRLDVHSGNFVYPINATKRIRLIGKGNRFHWTKKALERTGHLISEDAGIPQVEIIGNNWILIKEDDQYTCNSIQDLISKLGI